MKIINTLNKISDIYSKGSFDIEKWKEYILSINPSLEHLCINDMNDAIETGLVTFEKDYLPVLNDVNIKQQLLMKAIKSFETITNNLEAIILSKFNKTIDIEIILYLGLCNGAGWVTTINDKTYCLLGIEKIIELDWCDINSMTGLIFHELGHAYHSQYGILNREFQKNENQFLWQLFAEGIAMYFEQVLVGNFDYYHQDKDGWKLWCDNNINQIITDFCDDFGKMTFENQRFFGDWVRYNGYSDVGYYLGTRFIQYICKKNKFDDILSFDIDKVLRLFNEYYWILLLDTILSNYYIAYNNVSKVIDSSNHNDYRLNIFIDDKYVVRVNDSDIMSEHRLCEIQRLINRYNEIGVYVPHYIKNNEGNYSVIINGKICYISEYADYPLLEELDINREPILKEMLGYIGVLANKYTNYDLIKTKSMWSIIDLAPLDIIVDEKQENLNWLVDELNNIGEIEIANRVLEFNRKNREEILKVFDKLPRCVYQGDLNDANILVEENHFYGLIDFNLSGTEVNINYFLAETNRGIEEDDLIKYSANQLLAEMIKLQNEYLEIIFKNYTLNDVEKNVFENYRNIILISQYPNVCTYTWALKSRYRNKILKLIDLIINR